MLFSNHRSSAHSNIKVSIGGVQITRVTEARFLGVIIDEKLTWGKHVNAVKAKMNRYVGIMYKLKRHLPITARLQIYQSFIQSHINFCSLVWGFTSKSHIDSLFTKQKQGVRIVMPGFVNLYYRDGNYRLIRKIALKNMVFSPSTELSSKMHYYLCTRLSTSHTQYQVRLKTFSLVIYL